MNSKKRTIEQIPAKEFVDKWLYRIDLDADYQREKIWSRKNQEELLDSIIQDIDIPKLYLAKVEDAADSFDYECIDGKQRISSLLAFFNPDKGEEAPLTVRVAGEKLTYAALKREHPTIAAKMEGFELTVVIYRRADNELVREIFRRLQLGIRLNSGEMLNSHIGVMRDFVFKEMGSNAPFLRLTGLSQKRYSPQFTLAQIALNSFKRHGDDFVRARLNDLEDFFRENASLNPRDPNFARVRRVLKIMDRDFAAVASSITSRAAAVTAYFFAEDLCGENSENLVPTFAQFYEIVLTKINEDLARLPKYQKPKHPRLLEDFQKYISQASVEPYAIKRRHRFLKEAFDHYQKTKGKMIE